jgi:hypothetical protein
MKRAEFMTSTQKRAMASFASTHNDNKRTHENCTAATGVARPGKTAHDRSKRASHNG